MNRKKRKWRNPSHIHISSKMHSLMGTTHFYQQVPAQTPKYNSWGVGTINLSRPDCRWFISYFRSLKKKKNDDSIHRRRSLQMQKFHLRMELLFSLAVTIVISRACNNGVASFHSSTVVSINSSPLGRQTSGVCRIFFFKGGVLQLDAARDAVMKKSLKKKKKTLINCPDTG